MKSDLSTTMQSSILDRLMAHVDPDAKPLFQFFNGIGRTLLLAWTGQTFALGSTPIWVRNVAVALTLPGEVRP